MLEKLNAEEVSYLIGFLQGDGHHGEDTRNRGKIRIKLAEKDIDILNKLENILGTIINVSRCSRTDDIIFSKYQYQDYKTVNLTIHDLAFRTAIKPYVPVGCKSDIIEPPLELSNFSKQDYIRGLIDADGSIGISKDNRPFISLCISSEKIKEFLIKDIEEVTGLKKYMNRNKRDNVYNIMLNNEIAIQYATYLYQNSNLYLDRKYNEYLAFSKWERSIPKRVGATKKWFPHEDEIVLNNNLSVFQKVEILQRTDRSITIRKWRLQNKAI